MEEIPFLAIWRAKLKIRRIARRYCRRANVLSYGAINIDPGLLTICVTTRTDAQRDQLREIPELISAFRTALADVGYPKGAIAEVLFDFESKETVDRDYNGSWFFARK